MPPGCHLSLSLGYLFSSTCFYTNRANRSENETRIVASKLFNIRSRSIITMYMIPTLFLVASIYTVTTWKKASVAAVICGSIAAGFCIYQDRKRRRTNPDSVPRLAEAGRGEVENAQRKSITNTASPNTTGHPTPERTESPNTTGCPTPERTGSAPNTTGRPTPERTGSPNTTRCPTTERTGSAPNTTRRRTTRRRTTKRTGSAPNTTKRPTTDRTESAPNTTRRPTPESTGSPNPTRRPIPERYVGLLAKHQYCLEEIARADKLMGLGRVAETLNHLVNAVNACDADESGTLLRMLAGQLPPPIYQELIRRLRARFNMKPERTDQYGCYGMNVDEEDSRL